MTDKKIQEPFAGFKDFKACVTAQKKKDKTIEAANKICGFLQKKAEEVDVLGADAVIEQWFEAYIGIGVGPLGNDVIEKVSKTIVNYRVKDVNSLANCNECDFFSDGSCSVVAGDIQATDTCDVFKPASERDGYVITDMERFVKGLQNLQPLQLEVRGALETPVGVLIMLEDSLGEGHRYSMWPEEFTKYTSSWNGWTSAEALDIEIAGTGSTE